MKFVTELIGNNNTTCDENAGREEAIKNSTSAERKCQE
jgi:hypothetical protein